MPLKRVTKKSTTPMIDLEEEQNPALADPQSTGDENPTTPTNPETEINHAQIVRQVMATVEATIEEEIAGQGTEETTQKHPAPPEAFSPWIR